MNLDEAIIILELSNYNKMDITLSQIKKNYHKLALLHHPDKNNNSPESCKKFQSIQMAYELVNNELIQIQNEEKYNEDPESNDSYNDLLQIFIVNLIGEKNTGVIIKIMKGIALDYKNASLDKIFTEIDRDTALVIYNFLIKYQNILHIDNNSLDIILEKIKEKYKNILLYKLNPTLNDLLENNIYKLVIKENTYYCPLWHSELYFDDIERGDESLIVQCIPDLPDNIEIDDNNNLIVTLEKSLNISLLENTSIKLNIGKNVYDIPLDHLKLKKEQIYVFYKCGISHIDENNIYNIENKGDIIVKILFKY